jgi:hypothetical protein
MVLVRKFVPKKKGGENWKKKEKRAELFRWCNYEGLSSLVTLPPHAIIM